MRRDLINAEISNLRDLLPLPPSTRQRLSQLQLMALVCVYVRKMNYFQQVFKSHDFSYQYQEQASPTPNIGFSKAMNGFMMMMTQNGKLLYISENAAEYLGHSMEDLLIHGDSVYDIIDRQDHQTVQMELNRGGNGETENIPKNRHFFCRMNPVFLAQCTPLAMPETRECVVHGATNVFTTVHAMDMKILHIDANGQFIWIHMVLQVKDAADTPRQFIPCGMLDPRCQKFFRRDQCYQEPYQEYYVENQEVDYSGYHVSSYVQKDEYGCERVYTDRGPVDYSTHSPGSTISEESMYMYPHHGKREYYEQYPRVPYHVQEPCLEYPNAKRMRLAPSIALEESDGMDRWNPSPPWSDTTLKIPDYTQRFTYMVPIPPGERAMVT
ncbi:Neuronal PAS domain-containing protein 4 [Operophtera brumata]|uniref:Neuronal PAS domain-containing protein 4 n=1 Tax=Operophtera brumata TaxID=104452 RepID=A0A0L7L7C9_OPEBR|nr:Neuronal PAS domain-containing protein 4 [Operophtera brumata]